MGKKSYDIEMAMGMLKSAELILDNLKIPPGFDKGRREEASQRIYELWLILYQEYHKDDDK